MILKSLYLIWLVVVKPASMQKLSHLDLQLQVIVVSVKIEILLVFVLFKCNICDCSLYTFPFQQVYIVPEGLLPGHKAHPIHARHPNWVAVLLFPDC